MGEVASSAEVLRFDLWAPVLFGVIDGFYSSTSVISYVLHMLILSSDFAWDGRAVMYTFGVLLYKHQKWF